MQIIKGKHRKKALGLVSYTDLEKRVFNHIHVNILILLQACFPCIGDRGISLARPLRSPLESTCHSMRAGSCLFWLPMYPQNLEERKH